MGPSTYYVTSMGGGGFAKWWHMMTGGRGGLWNDDVINKGSFLEQYPKKITNIHNIGNMVLFLKRIPSPIGIWNAEPSRHRIVYFERSFLDTATENFLYLWCHYFVGPPPPCNHMSSFCKPPSPHGGDVICGCPLTRNFKILIAHFLLSLCTYL